MTWTIEDSKKLYAIDRWGEPFFHVNDKGNMAVKTDLKSCEDQSIDLLELTKDLQERGVRLPILVRFPDILHSRIKNLTNCFERAFKESGYKGEYCGVYPVKVNQEKHLVEDLVKIGEKYGLGLECGSKPELLIALSKMKSPKGIIVCNGFKDKDYIETALLSRKLGRRTIIVVDRFVELQTIIDISKKHDIKPFIGLRGKLSTMGSGRWAESSGNKSKFGLTPNEIVTAVQILKDENMLDSLELLHFHIGSQVPNIQSIKSSLKEGARFFAELFELGAKPKYMDVGGGLGVNYDGSGSSDSSVDYSDQEYANDVVYTIKSVCDEKAVPHPNIVTESGRSLVAHTSMLIFDVLGSNHTQSVTETTPITSKDHQVLRDLSDISNFLKKKNIKEAFNDLGQIKKDVLQLFTYGVLSLKQRAVAEEMINNIYIDIRKMVAKETDQYSDLIDELDSILCETYYCNFSVFQSLPDSWAMDQLFPVVPIHRLNELPERRAVLVDLTCDSDGTLDQFIDPTTSDSPQKYLEVHKLKKGNPYYIGVFLTGAYQEILGDMHNLFGDTDAVHVRFSKDSNYRIESLVKGDTIADVLKYVSFDPKELLDELRGDCDEGISNGSLTAQHARTLMAKFESSLRSHTYLN
jgi:arginine decarboxylase